MEMRISAFAKNGNVTSAEKLKDTDTKRTKLKSIKL